MVYYGYEKYIYKKEFPLIKKIIKHTGFIFIQLIIFLGIFLAATVFWVFRTWPSVTMNEILYHLQAPLQGAEPQILISFALWCLLPAVVVSIVGIVFLRKKLWKILVVTTAIIFCLCANSLIYAWNKLELSTYLKNQTTYSSFIDDNYVSPSTVSITFPEEKRNLIYIYLESMENTFMDVEAGGAFAENLIPNLTKLAMEYENFSGDNEYVNGAVVMNNATWTMGAMFAQSTGLPLILPIDGNAMYSQDTFFPELVGIGDILKDAGYKNLLLLGSHAMFGGREIFYQDHGTYKMLDYDYSVVNEGLSEDYFVWWGYEDAKLFENAKRHLLDVSQSDMPFNLTMLTVDTHYEDGYFCQDCESLHGENTYADVYNCSDKKVSEFVSWVQAQDFYKNTTIILVGDHLTMDSDFCRNIDEGYERKVYLSIINSAVEQEEYVERNAEEKNEESSDYGHMDVKNKAYRNYTTMDMFPTTLAALGAIIEGDRLGLGTNLYSEKPTLLELYGKEEMNCQMEQKSMLMDSLAATVDEGRLDENWKSLNGDEIDNTN